MVAGVIDHQAILFTLIQTKPAAHYLLIETHRLGGPKNGDEVHMGRIKARGEHRHVHQIFQLPLLEALNQQVPILQIGGARYQGSFVFWQVSGDLPRMLHGGRKDHHALTLGSQLHNLLNDRPGHALVFAQQLVNVPLGVFAKAVLGQRREIVLRHCRVHQLRPGEIPPVDHVTQRQLVNAVLKGLVILAPNKAPIVIAIDPAHGQTVRRSGQPEHFQRIVLLPQELYDALILTGFFPADPMAFIDNDQRVFVPKLIQVRRYRLHTGKGHLVVTFLPLQPGRENPAG